MFVPGRPRRQIIYDAARLGAAGKKSDTVTIQGALHSFAKVFSTRLWSTGFEKYEYEVLALTG